MTVERLVDQLDHALLGLGSTPGSRCRPMSDRFAGGKRDAGHGSPQLLTIRALRRSLPIVNNFSRLRSCSSWADMPCYSRTKPGSDEDCGLLAIRHETFGLRVSGCPRTRLLVLIDRDKPAPGSCTVHGIARAAPAPAVLPAALPGSSSG